MPRKYDYPIGQIEDVERRMSEDGYVYLIRRIGNKEYKIGKSIHPRSRIIQLSKQLKEELVLIGIIPCGKSCSLLEFKLHEQFNHKRTHGEWFMLNEEDVSKILVENNAIMGKELEEFPTRKKIAELFDERCIENGWKALSIMKDLMLLFVSGDIDDRLRLLWKKRTTEDK